MGLEEDKSIRTVWNERFRWLTVYFVAFGPLALASMISYKNVGLAGLLAFALPPALLILSVRQYLEHPQVGHRRMRTELRVTNVELAARNEDLRVLFDFTGGLAPRVHNREELVAYAEQWITTLTRRPGFGRPRLGRHSAHLGRRPGRG